MDSEVRVQAARDFGRVFRRKLGLCLHWRKQFPGQGWAKVEPQTDRDQKKGKELPRTV